MLTEIPEQLAGRGIEQPQRAHGFALSLDSAEPWGGGRVEGRVEARQGKQGTQRSRLPSGASRPGSTPRELVGQKPFFRLDTYWEARTRGVPIWIDEVVWLERREIGDLAEANWRHLSIELPAELPRAVEGTFVSFRWRVEAVRARRTVKEKAAVPLLLLEARTRPVIRVETSPLGHWRLLEWKADGGRDEPAGPCSITFEERRLEDMPRPGETREQELRRRTRG